MKYISIFSGVEAASCAWEPLGFEPVAFSEIDKYASEVLAKRFPVVPNVGDITEVDWSKYAGSIDIVVGGSPCQSFSIAGDRSGLDGSSRLMFEYVRCVQEIMPRVFVWENVPGALSSSRGEDFRCLLSLMDDLGYSLTWRVLDAQFFGVPQRRRRVFLVGCLGTNGQETACEILFERESMSRHAESSRGARERFAENIKRCARECYTAVTRCGKPGGGKGALVSENCSMTLSTSNNQVIFDGTKVGDDPSFVEEGAGFDYHVRKLTPLECERLQGFPDGWTNVEFNGKPMSDTQRYKMMGNSMAVPVMRCIGERIRDVLDNEARLA